MHADVLWCAVSFWCSGLQGWREEDERKRGVEQIWDGGAVQLLKPPPLELKAFFCPRGRQYFTQAPPPRPPWGRLVGRKMGALNFSSSAAAYSPRRSCFLPARNSWAWRRGRSLIGGQDLIATAVRGGWPARESARRHYLIFPVHFFTKRDGLPATSIDVQTSRSFVSRHADVNPSDLLWKIPWKSQPQETQTIAVRLFFFIQDKSVPSFLSLKKKNEEWRHRNVIDPQSKAAIPWLLELGWSQIWR